MQFHFEIVATVKKQLLCPHLGVCIFEERVMFIWALFLEMLRHSHVVIPEKKHEIMSLEQY